MCRAQLLADELLALAFAHGHGRGQQLLLLLEVDVVFAGLEAQLDRPPVGLEELGHQLVARPEHEERPS